MRLFRYGEPGRERPAALDAAGTGRDISSIVDDLSGENLGPESLARLGATDLTALPQVPEGARIGPCVARPGNFIGSGLSYRDHAIEAGFDIPEEPLLFNKAPNCINGPNDDVRLPRGGTKLDWEVEVAVVIGAPGIYLGEGEVAPIIAGYCVCNDVSERSFQMERGGQFMKGKGCPTFGPLGPWLVTPDEIADLQNLRLWLTVNGETMQDSNTRDMLFTIHQIVSHISQFAALEPGDVITTGTPAGVGMAKKPPRWLKPGDVVELSVEGLGTQRQRIVAAD